MKRPKEEPLSAVEQSAMAVAVILVGFGVYTAINPSEGTVFHPGTPGRLRGRPAQLEHVTERGSQFYGLLAIAAGLAIGWAALYRRR